MFMTIVATATRRGNRAKRMVDAARTGVTNPGEAGHIARVHG